MIIVMRKFSILEICFCISLLIVTFLLVSCDRLSMNNSDCYDEKPSEGEMSVRVTLGDTSDVIPVHVYKGKYEHNQLLFADSVNESQRTYLLPVNTYYTAVAEYEKGNAVILAVDGGKITVNKYVSEEDGISCWRVTNIKLDLRMK